MYASLAGALLLAATPEAARPGEPQAWTPVRIHLQCENSGRTKACPYLLHGFLDEYPALRPSPRAGADVVLYVNADSRGNEDLLLLRFVSRRRSVPPSLEIVQRLNTRASDDEVRAQLRPAFMRGISAYLAVLLPEALRVEIVAPEKPPDRRAEASPWDVVFSAATSGSWTANYRHGSLTSWIESRRLTEMTQLYGYVSGTYLVVQQPSLQVDGRSVALNSTAHELAARLQGAINLSDTWSTGLLLRGGQEDPDGRYRHSVRVHGGISYDWFRSDDPRGNQLSVTYFLGAQGDRYNLVNELDQTSTLFPSHGASIQGSVRRDRVKYQLNLNMFTQITDPTRQPPRFVLNLSPGIEVQVGDHVDLRLEAGITRQAAPGPRDVDRASYSQVSRLSYRDPLSIQTSFTLYIHWDRTNPDRNNRFRSAGSLRDLGTL